MNVEAYLRAQVPGYPFEERDLLNAVTSPILAQPSSLRGIDLNFEISDIAENTELKRSLKYAVSTLFYAVSGVFAGGSRSEQVGDVKVSAGGYSLAQSDREYFRNQADAIRQELGCEVESQTASSTGMFDATPLRRRKVWN
jgi:hypothetical protein